MKSVLEVAKERSLFFLDSCTTSKTIVASLAMDLGVPCVKRDIFLDDVGNKYEIKRQIYRLVDIARKNGSAVAIGHVGQMGKYTASVLKETLPELENVCFCIRTGLLISLEQNFIPDEIYIREANRSFDTMLKK